MLKVIGLGLEGPGLSLGQLALMVGSLVLAFSAALQFGIKILALTTSPGRSPRDHCANLH